MDEIKETWRDVVGFEGLYQVSDAGNIRSLTHYTRNNPNGGKRISKGRILKPFKAGANYLYVDLSKGDIREKRSVHRMVAIAFIENKNNLPEVNHIDGNKANNAIQNLEWVTRKENQNHAADHFLMGHIKPVICKETGTIYRSQTDAERKTGIDRHKIAELCKTGKEYNGVHWGWL